ncbi:MAG: thiamine diphosphokinase [Christensenellales bacterium]
MKCICVGAGERPTGTIPKDKDDFLIAVDGGYNYIAPDCIDMAVGDFDSLGYMPDVDNVIKLEERKNYTDMWVACQKGYELGYRTFVLYGATGGRFDHTVANVQLATHLAKKHCQVVIASVDNTIYVTADTVEIKNCVGSTASVFSPDRTVVDLDGFDYNGSDLVLTNDFPLGVSNKIIDDCAVVRVKEGVAVIIVGLEK